MAYCTPDNLEELGYTWEDSDTSNIAQICDTVSKNIDAYCKQTFAAQTGYTESGIIIVRCSEFKYFPKNLTITNIDSFAFKQVNGKIPPYTIQNYEYEPDKTYIIGYTNAPSGHYRVSVSYDFGYADGSYPDDLVKAAVLAAAPLLDDYFLSQDSNVSMVKSIKQGDLRIEREDTSVLPQNAISQLNGGNNGLGYVRVRATS